MLTNAPIKQQSKGGDNAFIMLTDLVSVLQGISGPSKKSISYHNRSGKNKNISSYLYALPPYLRPFFLKSCFFNSSLFETLCCLMSCSSLAQTFSIKLRCGDFGGVLSTLG